LNLRVPTAISVGGFLSSSITQTILDAWIVACKIDGGTQALDHFETCPNDAFSHHTLPQARKSDGFGGLTAFLFEIRFAIRYF
jgi:hypothetical protein